MFDVVIERNGYRRMMASLSSVEPSLTTMTS